MELAIHRITVLVAQKRVLTSKLGLPSEVYGKNQMLPEGAPMYYHDLDVPLCSLEFNASNSSILRSSKHSGQSCS